MANNLLGPLGDPHYLEYARDINASGAHLLNLITDLLDLSKIEAGRMELTEAPIEIAGVIDSAVRFVRDGPWKDISRLVSRLPTICLHDFGIQYRHRYAWKRHQSGVGAIRPNRWIDGPPA